MNNAFDDLKNAPGGATPGRIANLYQLCDKTRLQADAFNIEICSDERTGKRYGNAKKRRGYAWKLGHTSYDYQVWAVIKPEWRAEYRFRNNK